MEGNGDIGYAESLKQLYLKDELTEEYLTEQNLEMLFWYELTGYTYDPTKEELTQELISHATSCDNELIRFCLKALKNLGCEQKAKDLESEYTILKLMFSPSVVEQIKEDEQKREELEKKKNIYLRPLKFGALLIILTFLSTQYIFSSSTGINFFSVIVESIQEKLGLRVPNAHVNENKDLMAYALKWVPKDYDITQFLKEPTTYGEVFFYEYSCNNRESITLKAELYSDNSFDVDIETNGSIITFKSKKNDVYYSSENFDINQIIWNKYNVIFTLSGKVDKSVLNEIIEKNY